MMMALRPNLVPADRPHRGQFTESDPRNFHAPYRLEQHGSWQGRRDSAVITKALEAAGLMKRGL